MSHLFARLPVVAQLFVTARSNSPKKKEASIIKPKISFTTQQQLLAERRNENDQSNCRNFSLQLGSSSPVPVCCCDTTHTHRTERNRGEVLGRGPPPQNRTQELKREWNGESGAERGTSGSRRRRRRRRRCCCRGGGGGGGGLDDSHMPSRTADVDEGGGGGGRAGGVEGKGFGYLNTSA
jgi:hypothetical protein